MAWQKGFREAAGVLNPTVPIDSALETCRELGEGRLLLKAGPAFPTAVLDTSVLYPLGNGDRAGQPIKLAVPTTVLC